MWSLFIESTSSRRAPTELPPKERGPVFEKSLRRNDRLSVDVRRHLIEPQLAQFQTVVIVLPEEVLQAGVEQRNSVQHAVSVDVGEDKQELLAHIGEGALTLHANLNHRLDGTEGLAGDRI